MNYSGALAAGVYERGIGEVTCLMAGVTYSYSTVIVTGCSLFDKMAVVFKIGLPRSTIIKNY